MDKLSAIYNVALQKEAGWTQTATRSVKDVFNKANDIQLKAYTKATSHPIGQKLEKARYHMVKGTPTGKLLHQGLAKAVNYVF